MPQPTRVTAVETYAAKWFRAGSASRASYAPDRLRAPFVYRWINTGKKDFLKLIDITGQLRSGLHFACEVKSCSTNSYNWSSNGLNERQNEYLAAIHEWNGLALVWFGWLRSKTKLGAQYLIPYTYYRHLTQTVRWPDDKPGPFKGQIRKSWDREILAQYATQWALIPIAIRHNSRKQTAWFTRDETLAWLLRNEDTQHPHPIPLKLQDYVYEDPNEC